MAIVGNTEEGIINVNYKAIIEVLVEAYFKIIARKSTMFVRSQIASQLDTPLISERRYIISSVRV